MKKIFLAILIGVAVTVLFFALGGVFSGGDHDLTAITVFFPYSLSLGILTKDSRWGRIGGFAEIALLVLQFPVYAVILTTIKDSRFKAVALLILLALHVSAVLIGLRIYRRSRPTYFYGAIQQMDGSEGRVFLNLID